MNGFLSIICEVLILGIFAACVPAPDFSHETPLSQYTKQRINLHEEWRSAYRITPGSEHIIRLDSPAPSHPHVLRLGVYTGASNGPPAAIRLFSGLEQIAAIAPKSIDEWQDYRIPIARGESGDQPYRLVIETAHDVWLGPCEIVSRQPSPPNILFYLVDTVRQDHLHCYGYPRQTSPHLDAFAKESIVFSQLAPQSSWTKPSVASLLTSCYPATHGAQDRPDILRPGLPDFAESLTQNGYETHGLITNANILPLWGFGSGFFRYVDIDSSDTVNSDDAKIVDKAIATIENAQDRPWFLYVHTMGPHEPYEPPQSYARQFNSAYTVLNAQEIQRRQIIDAYDAELAYSDAQFQRFLDALKSLNLYDQTLIVFLSDHGEEFWDHGGTSHGKTLYEEMLRIPLLIKLPSSQMAGERRDDLVEMVDVAPTLLDLLSLPAEPRFQGRSFRSLIETNRQAPRMGYASLVNLAASMRVAKTKNLKYLLDIPTHQESCFDLTADPAERFPLSQAPQDIQPLRDYAKQMAMRGAEGLHILMTCGDGAHTVSGTISAPSLGPYDLQYYEWKSTVSASNGGLQFQFLTIHPDDVNHQRDVWHRQLAEQDNAHLRISVRPEDGIKLEIRVDGQPIAADLITFGGKAGSLPCEANSTLRPLDLLGDVDSYDPAGLPRKFAIYVWYVAPVNVLQKQDLDPKIRETLTNLGYL